MNVYVCFYRGKRFECRAETTLKAQEIAVKHFKARRAWDVSVVLAEKDGDPVTHTAVD